MTTTSLKTKSTKAAVSKSAKNTPVKKAEGKKASEKKASTTTKKASVFALVAGLAVKIEHKALKQAVKYHVAKGSLKLTPQGVALTEQGKALWDAERVAKDPAQFQAVAMFVHSKGEAPANSRWQTGGARVTVAEGMEFPPLIHWGSFSNSFMRQAFAAIWAK